MNLVQLQRLVHGYRDSASGKRHSAHRSHYPVNIVQLVPRSAVMQLQAAAKSLAGHVGHHQLAANSERLIGVGFVVVAQIAKHIDHAAPEHLARLAVQVNEGAANVRFGELWRARLQAALKLGNGLGIH